MMDKQLFERIVDRRYASMTKRFASKIPGDVIPFTREEYRAWILNLLGRRRDGRAECHYCHHTMPLDDLEIDHRLPPSRGGTLGFENLVPACKPCNQQKGAMTDAAFKALLIFASQLPLTDRANLLGRLQKSTKFIMKAGRRKRSNTIRLSPTRHVREPRVM